MERLQEGRQQWLLFRVKGLSQSVVCEPCPASRALEVWGEMQIPESYHSPLESLGVGRLELETKEFILLISIPHESSIT